MTDDPRAAFTEALETGIWPELPEAPKPRDPFTITTEVGVPIRVQPGMPIRLQPAHGVEDLNEAMKAVWVEATAKLHATEHLLGESLFDRPPYNRVSMGYNRRNMEQVVNRETGEVVTLVDDNRYREALMDYAHQSTRPVMVINSRAAIEPDEWQFIDRTPRAPWLYALRDWLLLTGLITLMLAWLL